MLFLYHSAPTVHAQVHACPIKSFSQKENVSVKVRSQKQVMSVEAKTPPLESLSNEVARNGSVDKENTMPSAFSEEEAVTIEHDLPVIEYVAPEDSDCDELDYFKWLKVYFQRI
uniref:Uncharacterized protein n=1 Tax=Amphimedon queenslandica TaxID=400682 RepID=A0A1X7UQC4_AMPQE